MPFSLFTYTLLHFDCTENGRSTYSRLQIEFSISRREVFCPRGVKNLVIKCTTIMVLGEICGFEICYCAYMSMYIGSSSSQKRKTGQRLQNGTFFCIITTYHEHKSCIFQHSTFVYEYFNFQLIFLFFRWEVEDWQACSQTCGGGFRTRLVKCIIDKDGNKVQVMFALFSPLPFISYFYTKNLFLKKKSKRFL